MLQRFKSPVIEAGVWPQAKDIASLAQTYVDLDAVLAKNVTALHLSSMATVPLLLATGAAAAEVVIFVIPPLFSGIVPVEGVLLKGQRLSVKAVVGTVGAGLYLSINGFAG